MKKIWKWPYIGLMLGGLTLALKSVGGAFSPMVEAVYSRTLFPGVRHALDHSFGLLPFSAIYFLIILIPVWLVWGIYRHRGKRVRLGWLRRGGWLLVRMLAVSGLTVTTGYWFWGFNYDRVPLDRQLSLELRPLDEGMIRSRILDMAGQLTLARAQIPRISSAPLNHGDLPVDLEGMLRSSFTMVLGELGYPAAGRVRLRFLFPGSLLMRLGIAGFYFPFTGEANLPDSLTPEEIPFAAAHEMAHAHGFADEGEANLVAFLVCIGSQVPVIRYSGYMGYFDYIAMEYYRISVTEYRRLLEGLPEGVRADMRQTRDNWKRHRSWLTRIGSTVNNLYLKSQGVKEGILSYNRLLVLYEGYLKKTRTRERGTRTDTD